LDKSEEQTRPTQAATNRRSFLNWLWVGLGLAALAEIVVLINSYLTSRRSKAARDDFETVIEAGQVDAFKPNTVTAFPRGQFYLACLEGSGFLAISRRCTHLGCTVPWNVDQQRFICPCHASVFDIRGDVIEAPAPRALDLLRVTIENKVIKVHTGDRIKRSIFKTEQIVYPGRL
jgi:cytochrome b6-f complex iron-sulfur subunit